MEQSILHLKVPHELHIGAKARASYRGISMNKYIQDLISTDLGEDSIESARIGIRAYRESTPKEKETLVKAAKIMDELVIKDTVTPKKHVPKIITKPEDVNKAIGIKPGEAIGLSAKFCKIHFTMLDSRGRCLQKGCKYA